MNSQDLLNLVTKYNSKRDEILDRCTDILIRQFYDEIELIYTKGEWAKMLQVSAIGYTVASITDDFTSFNKAKNEHHQEFIKKNNAGISWLFYDYADSVDETEEMGTLIRYKKAIDEEIWNYKHIFEIFEFDNYELYKLNDFVEKLEEKGFRCFVNTFNETLMVVLDIRTDVKKLNNETN